MKIYLIILLLIFSCLGVYASDIAEPAVDALPSAASYVAKSAINNESSIVQMKAERMETIVGCDRVLCLIERNLQKKLAAINEAFVSAGELVIARMSLGAVKKHAEIQAELKSIGDKNIAEINAAAAAAKDLKELTNIKKLGLLTEVSALDVLTAALEVTPCLDIGGIRTPLCCGSIYNLSDESHITLNSSGHALPNFLFARGLSFGKVLGTFPELRTILSTRGTPVGCLISHVGVNIFDDVMGEQLEKYPCSLDDMSTNYDVLVRILPEFVSDFAQFLKLFKGGRFTYKSLKKDSADDHQGYFLGNMKSKAVEPIEGYTCWLDEEYRVLEHFSFVQDVDDLCTHEALFGRILNEVLGLGATTKINYVGECMAIYSQTLVDIPGTFTGEINHGKLASVIQWFLSKKPAATCSAIVGV